MANKKEFVIDRSKWKCGNGPCLTTAKHERGLGDTHLLNDAGFMCCLGFVSRQLGCKKSEILDLSEPCSLADTCGKNLDGVLLEANDFGRLAHSTLTIEAMAINDSPRLTPQKRESKLRKLFKTHGFILRFFGRYVNPNKVSGLR